METQENPSTLSAETYTQGLLVDEEIMAGVTQLPSGVFAMFVTELESARTVVYEEFETLEAALAHINGMGRPWHFESFGCDKGSSCRGGQRGACETCAANTACC